uniref:Uncharacterized protein n=1 Tax=Talaromyces marneffei PM1 TaxID=1077442 RepID=A0A093VP44_TALMA
MSGPYRPGYPGNAGTPLSPASQANQPVSFKTDINRKKTKKWVAAKSYSYDGDDWGDDDDEEEEEEDQVEEAPPVPDTSRSAPAVQQLVPNPVAPANPNVESAPRQAPTFVRPADIYKRMQEEKKRERASQESGRSNTVPAEGAAASFAPTPEVHQNTSKNVPSQQPPGDTRSPLPLVIPEVKRLSGFGQDLFGNTSQPDQAAQPTHSLEAPEAVKGSSLHHNPSLGFTSVVHQAFDVEETPTSSSGGFSRSNSDGTSVISPIISPWKSETDKTPTIAEDPTAEASAQEPPANFKLGHRRDLSIPSPGNGPDRVPTIANADEGQSAVVRSSSQDSYTASERDDPESPAAREQTMSGEATPRPLSAVQQSFDQLKLEPTSTESAIQLPSEESHPHVPSPLQIPDEQPPHIPQIAQPLTVDESPVTEASPQDMESDRLRKEIMRSFSSDEIPGVVPVPQAQNIDSEEPKSRPHHESTYLPSEYDSYWGEQGIPPTSPLQVRSAISPSEPVTLVINPQSTENAPSTEPVQSSGASKPRPTLKKKFSWETSDDSEEDVLEETPVSAASPHSTQPQPVVAAVSETIDSISVPLPSQTSTEINPEAFGSSNIQPSLPEYPTAEKEVLEQFEKQAEEPQSTLEYIAPIQEPEPSAFSEIDGNTLPPQTQPVTAPVNEASLPTFRKIMEISAASEKIQVFNDTREQFAHIDSGLSDWIRRSSESLPEHADLIQANGSLPGGVPISGLPPRAKFPKLSSLGNLSLPSTSSHGPDGSGSGFTPGHNRRGSGSHITGVINRSNVESKGKDFLHSAGALGGKAGGKAAGAARGLFAKGKNKFRGGDKGMSSIFRAQRRQSWATSTADSDAQSSELEFDDQQEIVNFSVTSRYSLQPVPRIPSLRLGDGKLFGDSFDGGEAFSMHARSFSADFSGKMRSLTEGEPIAFRPERTSSLRRTMMAFESDPDKSSRAGDSSTVQDGISIAMGSHESGDLGSVEDLNTPIVATSIHGTNNTILERKPGETSVGKSGPPHTDVHTMDKDRSSSANNVGNYSQPNTTSHEGTISPLNVSPQMSPPLKHEPSQSNNQVSRLSQNNDIPDTASPQPTIKPTMQQTLPDAVNSMDESFRSPVSPPLPQGSKLDVPEPANRRDSIISQISEISQDEMDRIREKFDEDGVYAGLGDPSPTRSQVSDLTEDDDDVDDAIREKLDEAGFHSDPEKDTYESFPRPATASSNQQAIRVVRMSRFSIDKKTMQSTEEDTTRHSRFSFEGEGNTLAEQAEEMLVSGHARRSRQTDYPGGNDAGLEGSQVPVTLGEDAPDEAPPPFPDSGAECREDHKEQQEPQEQTPAYDDNNPDRCNGQSLRAKRAKSPPGYQPIQSPPPSHIDTLWKTGRLQDLRTNRDSIASSSVSSISNPNVNPNAPRMTVSPGPPLSGGQNQRRLSHNVESNHPQNLPCIGDVTASDRPGLSLWANHGRPEQSQQHSFDGSGLNPPILSGSSSGRRDRDSLHSGDSMAVQAASSRQDLRTTPSPLIYGSETASEHSNHGKMSTQLLSKVKFMGKRTKGAPAPASVPLVEAVDAKVVERRKEKKIDGKKGALSRFGGIFNRAGPSQRPGERVQPAQNSQASHDSWGNGAHPSYPPAANQQQGYMPTTASSRHTSMPTQDKGLPPPPGGYYAPPSKPVYEPPVNYGHQINPQYENAYVGGYQHTPAPAQYAPSNGQYSHPSTLPPQSPPFQSQAQLRQPQLQPQPAQYEPSNDHYAYHSSAPLHSQPQLHRQPEQYAPREDQYAYQPSQPQPQLQPQPQNQISTSSRSYNNISPTINSSNSRASNASPGLEQSRSRAHDLRVRSRSPRPVQMRTTTSRSENVNYADPAYNLGKFHAVTETARIGDQSLPFPITLPEDLANGKLSPRNSIQPESSIFHNRNKFSAGGENAGLSVNQETRTSIMSDSASAGPTTTTTPSITTPGHNNRARNSETYETRPVIAKNTSPVELPVPSDSDEEEIVMSSTAYPGQEWQPAGFEQWMPY